MEGKKFPKKLAIAWFAVLALTTALAACGNKGGGGGSSTPAVVTPSCLNCANLNQATLVSATSSYPFSASWTFSGDAGLINTIRTNNPYAEPVWSYGASGSAPLVVTGTLNIGNGLAAGSCVIPVGTYTVTTLNLGNAVLGTFAVPQLSATNGSVVINFSLSQGIIYSAVSGSGVYTATGYMNVTSVSGAACSVTIPFN